jgi:hypothetical protein
VDMSPTIIAATPDSKGSRIVGANGAVPALGDAKFFGSHGREQLVLVLGYGRAR